MGTQAMQITNQAISPRSARTPAAGSPARTWSATSSAAPSGRSTAGTLYDTHGWAGVCLLGAGFGLLTLALSAYEWLRPLPGGRSECGAPAGGRTEPPGRDDPDDNRSLIGAALRGDPMQSQLSGDGGSTGTTNGAP